MKEDDIKLCVQAIEYIEDSSDEERRWNLHQRKAERKEAKQLQKLRLEKLKEILRKKPGHRPRREEVLQNHRSLFLSLKKGRVDGQQGKICDIRTLEKEIIKYAESASIKKESEKSRR